MKIFILENTWFKRDINDFGWGNGYVLIPEGHSLHGKDHTEINDLFSVHGGLTYSALVDDYIIEKFSNLGLDKEDKGKWIVGFDTFHYGDTLSEWTKERVLQETLNLRDQILAYDKQSNS